MVCEYLVNDALVVVTKDNGQRATRIDHEMRSRPVANSRVSRFP
jgi:hypothetical protein